MVWSPKVYGWFASTPFWIHPAAYLDDEDFLCSWTCGKTLQLDKSNVCGLWELIRLYVVPGRPNVWVYGVLKWV